MRERDPGNDSERQQCCSHCVTQDGPTPIAWPCTSPIRHCGFADIHVRSLFSYVSIRKPTCNIYVTYITDNMNIRFKKSISVANSLGFFFFLVDFLCVILTVNIYKSVPIFLSPWNLENGSDASQPEGAIKTETQCGQGLLLLINSASYKMSTTSHTDRIQRGSL